MRDHMLPRIVVALTLGGCLLSGVVGLAGAQERPARYHQNGRNQVTGREADAYSFAPAARVGIHFFFNYQPGPSNRGNPWVRPWANDELRRQGAVSSWAEWYARFFDPLVHWIEFNSARRSGVYVFETPFGETGAYRRYQGVDELDRALRYGRSWLVEGFFEGCRLYAEGGSTIVVHNGSADSGDWARSRAARNTQADRAEILRVIYELDSRIVAAGCEVGHDALSAFDGESISFARFQLLKSIGAAQQMEATYPPAKRALYGGTPCMIHWAPFKSTHLEPQAAEAKSHKMPLLGTPAFDALYSEVRVVVTAEAFLPEGVGPLVPIVAGKAATDPARAAKVAAVGKIADGVQELLGRSPRVRVLLVDWIARSAVDAGVPFERFLPPGK